MNPFKYQDRDPCLVFSELVAAIYNVRHLFSFRKMSSEVVYSKLFGADSESTQSLFPVISEMKSQPTFSGPAWLAEVVAIASMICSIANLVCPYFPTTRGKDR